MQDIKDLNLEELKVVLSDWRQPEFRALQIFSWIYQKGAAEFERMSDLPAALREKLKDNFRISGLKLIKRLESRDGTEKFLLELQDKDLIECVNIPTQKRVTGCISSQVGCKFACRFCASGLSGFKRNLFAGEILSQVLYLKNNSSAHDLTHIVFMGTGEPLDNYDFVLKAIRIINSKDALNIGARRITISTCGIIPGIRRLADEELQIELSISLHAADDKIRSALLPVNKKYPLKELMAACKEYIARTDRQITFEYILIKGLNSGLPEALKLSTMLRDLRLVKVNLIMANSVKELNIEPPNKLEILLFKDTLLKSGINVTIRKSRGGDIDAACGQLKLGYAKK